MATTKIRVVSLYALHSIQNYRLIQKVNKAAFPNMRIQHKPHTKLVEYVIILTRTNTHPVTTSSIFIQT